MTNIVLLKLISDVDLVALRVSDDKAITLKIQKPVHLVMGQDQTGKIGFSPMPWGVLAGNDFVFEISPVQMIYQMPAPAELEALYRKVTGMVELPSTGLLIPGVNKR
jgi:hypothetical protein